MTRLRDSLATFTAQFNSRVPLAAQSALPSLRRAAERHAQGSLIAGNTAKVSDAAREPVDIIFTVQDSRGALFSRWWLRKRSLPSQSDGSWNATARTLVIRVGSGPGVSSIDPMLLSLGDILAMGLVTRLELFHVVLLPTPPALTPYLLHPLPLKVLRVRRSQVQLNELLTVMNTNAASLTKVETSFIALPTLQVFGLCPLLSELELQGASIGHAQMGIGASPSTVAVNMPYRPFSDLAPLTNLFRLDLSKCAQELDLSGLRFCNSVRVINMSSSMLSQKNVADLGRLSQVTDLLLSKTCITDVRALSNCENLAQLQLAGTQVTAAGLQGLGRLKKLHHVDLSNTPVNSVQDLCLSKSLTTLILWKSQMITDGLRGIERVPSLEHLNIGDTVVDQAGFLATSLSLRLLNIQSTLVDASGLEGFGACVSLSELQAGNTPIKNTQGLRGCWSLKKLDLYGSRVDGLGISHLSSLKQLEELILSNTDVDDVRALVDCTELRVLEMKHVKLPNSEALSGLERLPRLTKLLVTHCGVDSVNNLRQAATLQVLNLWSTKVTTEGIQGLGDLQSLEELDLAETQVTDISSLLSCHQLRGLTLYSCPLASVEGLENLHCLRRLDIANTRVVSVSCLSTCRSLEVLNISDTQIDDDGFSGIGHIRSLKSILLNNTHITRIGELGSCPVLEELHAGTCGVTAAGLAGVERAVNLQKLNLAYTKLGSGITRLALLHHLKKLYLKGSEVTVSDVEHLQRYLPNCRISQDAHKRRDKERAFFPNEV